MRLVEKIHCEERAIYWSHWDDGLGLFQGDEVSFFELEDSLVGVLSSKRHTCNNIKRAVP